MKTTPERAREILDEERGNGYREAFLSALGRILTMAVAMAGDKGLSRRDESLLRDLVGGMISDAERAEIPYAQKEHLRDKARADFEDMLGRVGRRS